MRLSAVLFSVVLVVSAPALAVGPPDTSGLEWAPHPGGLVPDVTAETSDGRSVPLLGLTGGRPAIVDLNYYNCPTLCGLARDSLLSALSGTTLRPGRDYTLLAFSIDPAETPAMAAQAKAADTAHYPVPGNEAGWVYAVAGAADIRAVSGAIGFPFRWNEELKQFIHPTGIAVLAPDGRISSYVFGVGYDPASLSAAIERASAGTVVPAPSPILLLCFHYDAVTGKYSLEVIKVLRLAAAGIVLAVGGLLWRLRYLRRRVA